MAGSLIHGFTRNWADLADDQSDPDLRPVEVALPPAEAVARVAGVIAGLPRWAVVAADPAAGTIHATHKTLLWRFVDDVRLRFEPHGSGTRLLGRSRSRIGKGDLGQNARNLRGLTAALRAGVPALPPVVHDR